MTTTDFHHAEVPTGAGAGGTTPRRLIPSCFQPIAPARKPEHWAGSVVWVTAVLTITAAASIGLSVALDHVFK